MTVIKKPSYDAFLEEARLSIEESEYFKNIPDNVKKWENVFALIFASLPRIHKTSILMHWAMSVVGTGATADPSRIDVLFSEMDLILHNGAKAKRAMMTLGLHESDLNVKSEIKLPEAIQADTQAIKENLTQIQVYLDLMQVLGGTIGTDKLVKIEVLEQVIDSEYLPECRCFKINEESGKNVLKIIDEPALFVIDHLVNEIKFEKRYYPTGFDY